MKDAKGSFAAWEKRLGIVGYGNIGSQVSVIAQRHWAMKVIFYDIETKLPFGKLPSDGKTLSATSWVGLMLSPSSCA